MAEDEPSGERCPSTNANNPGVRAVPLVVHPEGVAEAADHAPNEDEVEPVGVVRKAIEDVSDEHGRAHEVQWSLIDGYERSLIENPQR